MPAQGFCALSDGAAGGVDIVHQEQALTDETVGPGNGKGTSDVLFPLGSGQAGLGSGPAGTTEVVQREGDLPAFCQYLADKLGLIEAPFPQPPTMQGHRNEEIGRKCRRDIAQGSCGQEAQRAGEVNLFSVFEAMDEFLQWTFKARRGACPAKGATLREALAANVVTAVFCCKRDAADQAEGRIDRNDLLPAAATEMDFRRLGQKTTADVAERWEKHIKEGLEEHFLRAPGRR